MNAHVFFGCKFGDTKSTVWVNLKSEGYEANEYKGRFMLPDGADFAGIYFGYVMFTFTSNKLSAVSFTYEDDDYQSVFDKTIERLTQKYGEGVNGNGMTIWVHESTGIICALLDKPGREKKGFMLVYKDNSVSADDEL
jgi:hypothetical protein